MRKNTAEMCKESNTSEMSGSDKIHLSHLNGTKWLRICIRQIDKCIYLNINVF